MAEGATPWITEAVVNAQSIHILGAGLNSARPAHQAIHDLDGRGWSLVPICLLYTSPSPRDGLLSRMPSSA